MSIIVDRTLKYTYGIEITRNWKEGDPMDRKENFEGIGPHIAIFKTTELNAEFCNESGMKLHGELIVDIPDIHLGLDREVEFSLIFGKMELVAKAKNVRNGKSYNTSFELDFNLINSVGFL
ncbi:hypothetical protein GLOIN_2v1502209 [Rhizophagus clarus]|uniref:Uncharacterized protein n=1 Tax=Rhizophagus clarus TaxID=94130 RepID=A0A8H3L975_9GLOM|nr:hypothetical protein GLOIN_2v1502209 [Rhizophagus clarus]